MGTTIVDLSDRCTEDKMFKDQEIDVTWASLVGCIFVRCKFRAKPGSSFSGTRCIFDDCRIYREDDGVWEAIGTGMASRMVARMSPAACTAHQTMPPEQIQRAVDAWCKPTAGDRKYGADWVQDELERSLDRAIMSSAYAADAAFCERAEAHLGGPVKVQTWGGPEYGVPMHHFAVPLKDQLLSMNEMRRFARGWTGGDVYCEPVTACTAHVDPLAQQQAQTAGQMRAAQNTPTSTISCRGCRTIVKRNNAVWDGSDWKCTGCAAGAQAQQPASAMPPWGNWPNIVPPASGGNERCHLCGSDVSGTTWRGITAAGAFVCKACGLGSAQPADPSSVGDFGAQVSDQLASARGIDKAAANDRMRVPTFEEAEAERARMAEHFRKCGVL